MANLGLPQCGPGWRAARPAPTAARTIEASPPLQAPATRVTLLAARLFLEGQFEDKRGRQEVAAGVPMSYSNCLDAARFTALALADLADSQRAGGRWRAMHGTCLTPGGWTDFHAFAAWYPDGAQGASSFGAVADLTADQFGWAEIIAVGRDGRYQPDHRMRGAGWPASKAASS